MPQKNLLWKSETNFHLVLNNILWRNKLGIFQAKDLQNEGHIYNGLLYCMSFKFVIFDLFISSL